HSLLFVALFLLLSTATFAQLNPKGSAAEMTGNLYILSIFATTEGEPWEQSSKETLASAQYEAEEWLKVQAANHKAALNIRAGSFGLDSDLSLSSLELFPEGRKRQDWIPTLLKKIGYLDTEEFHSFVSGLYKADNVLVLIYTNQAGTGYPMIYNVDQPESFVEGAVICRYYAETEATRPVTIAQEILRTFDAKDLFEGGSADPAQAALAAKLYPNDLMVKYSSDINETEIGAFTAYKIGWVSDLPKDAAGLK
ncbi:MAG: hypothetical protein AAF598_09775, partial [Bacteroidota bacterium]